MKTKFKYIISILLLISLVALVFVAPKAYYNALDLSAVNAGALVWDLHLGTHEGGLTPTELYELKFGGYTEIETETDLTYTEMMGLAKQALTKLSKHLVSEDCERIALSKAIEADRVGHVKVTTYSGILNSKATSVKLLYINLHKEDEVYSVIMDMDTAIVYSFVCEYGYGFVYDDSEQISDVVINSEAEQNIREDLRTYWDVDDKIMESVWVRDIYEDSFSFWFA